MIIERFVRMQRVNNLPSVFSVGSRPWINSDGSNLNDIIDTIKKCPSGALSYSIDGVEYRDPDEQRNPILRFQKMDLIILLEGLN